VLCWWVIFWTETENVIDMDELASPGQLEWHSTLNRWFRRDGSYLGCRWCTASQPYSIAALKLSRGTICQVPIVLYKEITHGFVESRFLPLEISCCWTVDKRYKQEEEAELAGKGWMEA
jgi:hypothetical protein